MKSRIEIKTFAWADLKNLPLNRHVKLGYATTALWDGEIAGIYHHGNQIAAITKETISITHRGYNSNVTRDRLDQILTANYGFDKYRVRKHRGLISLVVNGGQPIAFDTITLERKGLSK
jgi:hypothetical protein